jgi:hypothetical protein
VANFSLDEFQPQEGVLDRKCGNYLIPRPWLAINVQYILYLESFKISTAWLIMGDVDFGR